MNGALYVIPGSHNRGRIEPYYDESTSYKFWAVPKQQMISILRESEKPVPILGRAGTAALFHCNTLHASGHNLTAEDRWHVYISFNSCANAPRFGPNTRPTGWSRATLERYRWRPIWGSCRRPQRAAYRRSSSRPFRGADGYVAASEDRKSSTARVYSASITW